MKRFAAPIGDRRQRAFHQNDRRIHEAGGTLQQPGSPV